MWNSNKPKELKVKFSLKLTNLKYWLTKNSEVQLANSILTFQGLGAKKNRLKNSCEFIGVNSN